MKWKEKKLGRHPLGTFKKEPKQYGDYVKITAKFDGRCTLCHGPVSKDMQVCYNKNRMPGCKIAHISCVIRSLDSE
jgi:hypothetical protein